MAVDAFPQILKTFGQNLGLDGLSLDERGDCLLSFDQVLVNLHWNQENLLIFSPVGELPSEASAAVYEELLAANCLRAEGWVLGLEPQNRSVIISAQLPARDLELAKLENFLAWFVDRAENWQIRLEGLLHGDEAKPLPSAPEFGLKA